MKTDIDPFKAEKLRQMEHAQTALLTDDMQAILFFVDWCELNAAWDKVGSLYGSCRKYIRMYGEGHC